MRIKRGEFLWFLLTALAEIVLYVLAFLNDLIDLSKETLFWLFSAVSQSLAALFGVVALFATFRYLTLTKVQKKQAIFGFWQIAAYSLGAFFVSLVAIPFSPRLANTLTAKILVVLLTVLISFAGLNLISYLRKMLRFRVNIGGGRK